MVAAGILLADWLLAKKSLNFYFEKAMRESGKDKF